MTAMTQAARLVEATTAALEQLDARRLDDLVDDALALARATAQAEPAKPADAAAVRAQIDRLAALLRSTSTRLAVLGGQRAGGHRAQGRREGAHAWAR